MTVNVKSMAEVSEEDKLRAGLYDFLGLLLSGPPSAELLQQTGALTGDDSELGQAIKSMARVAAVTQESTVESEFNALFIGMARGELLPYASFYLTGFLNEKPLALLRKDMAVLGIERAENVFEPEDNIASIFEMMAGMILGRYGGVVPLDQQITYFKKHIGNWVPHFFTDLEGARNSVFYVSVGAAGRAFLEIEREAFRMISE